MCSSIQVYKKLKLSLLSLVERLLIILHLPLFPRLLQLLLPILVF